MERDDGKKTWEDERILEKSKEVKELIDSYNKRLEAQKNAALNKFKRIKGRKRDLKGEQKGSFERGNKP